MSNTKNLSGEYYEILSLTHICSIITLYLGIIVYNQKGILSFQNNLLIYSFLVLFSIVMLAVCNSTLQDSKKNSINEISISYVITLFILSILILVTVKDNLLIFVTTLMLPVLFAASSFGKKTGVAVAVGCSFLFIIYQINLAHEKSIQNIFESSLVYISGLIIQGWFIGSIIDLERKYQGILKENLKEILEKERLEKELFRLDSLHLVGEMAASIGHEVRNPITTVRGFLQLFAEKEGCANYKEYFSLMIEELDRANSILTEFLSLAKNKTVTKVESNLNRIIESFYQLILADITNADMEISLKLHKVPDLLLDEKEIRQLLLNMVHNGIAAMAPKGILTIETYMEGNEVVLAIKDQGKGIPTELLEKIGTPFFTTKDNGTGLGLAVCYSIAARHNAKIEIDTSSSGTTFFVRFKQNN